MPPKKNTAEQELKKRNKQAAENLVNMLEQKTNNVEDLVSTVNRDDNAQPVLARSSRVAKRVENSLQRTKDAIDSKSKPATASDKIESKRSTEKEKPGSKRSTEKEKPGSKRSTEKEKPDSKLSTQKEKPDLKRSTEKDNRVLKRPLDKLDAGSSWKTSKNVGSKIAKGESAGKRISNATKSFRYEIDCQRVKDSVDVKDLQQFVTMQLKVNGEKNNLEDNVTVCVDGHRVVINSKVYLPKRSLRFLSKKFLKKSWNIQVVSQNKNSYEFKYVGTS